MSREKCVVVAFVGGVVTGFVLAYAGASPLEWIIGLDLLLLE